MKVKNLDDTKKDYLENKNQSIIIIVDDNEEHLLMYKFLFTSINKNHKYLTFFSADKAIEKIKNLYNEDYRRIFNETGFIKLIISDYNMNPFDGLEFYKKVKEIDESLHFILFSSFLSNSVIKKAYELGIVKCIKKELNIKETVNKLRFHIV